MLIQLPIFIALFNVIGQAWELRGAGFLWIDDLSRPDRLFPFGFTIPLLGSYFNLLPVIMAGTQVLVSNLSSSPGADEKQLRSQRRGMLIMAILFMLLFYPFPSGLILYWTCSNLGQFVQQQIMVRFGRSLAAPEAP